MKDRSGSTREELDTGHIIPADVYRKETSVVPYL